MMLTIWLDVTFYKLSITLLTSGLALEKCQLLSNVKCQLSFFNITYPTKYKI